MDRDNLCENFTEEKFCSNGSVILEKNRSTLISKLTRIVLQLLIVIAVFLLFNNFILAGANTYDANLLVNVVCAAIASLCAYLILMKYQMMVQQFSMENLRLGEKLGERNIELLRANEEMRMEINHRRLMEQALGESEGRFRAIFRESAIGIALLDSKGRFLECNPVLQKMLGYDLEELQGMGLNEINHVEEMEAGRKYFREILAGGKGICQIEKRYYRKDGQERWCSQSISVVRDAAGKLKFLIAMIEDITNRREVEGKLSNYQKQLRSLATELSLTEERERRSLATCLHDHIGQALALAKMKIIDMVEMLPGSDSTSLLKADLTSLLKETKRLVEDSIRYTKSVVFELSPPTLYDLGFEATVEWLAEQMKKDHGLLVKVNNDRYHKPIDIEIGVVLFRAVRELLLNVVKHANATIAIVTMSRVNNKLHISIEDNGKGFILEKDKHKINNGYGIFSIRERIEYLEGKFHVDSKANQGTKIMLEIPMKLQKNQRKARQKPKKLLQEPLIIPKAPAARHISLIK